MLELLVSVLIGAGIGLSLAAPPGPITALAAERAVHRGFWPGYAVILGAITADGTHLVLVALGIIPVAERVPFLLQGLTLAGALLMLWFAWGAWRTARAPPAAEQLVERGEPKGRLVGFVRGGFATGYAIAISSPYNIAWWLGVGTSLVGDYGGWVFVGFFGGLLVYGVVFLEAIRFATGRVKGFVAVVSYGSAVALAGFGLWLLYTGLREVLQVGA